ncbi:hypothetical protein T10_6779 [Trichinella papuae]|uniref:Uncharacterized protein n=1 Tax=Trichinella papuae TaxID=268474 RepID=A0A0V1N9T2_9BILA|nr:hypothetical protein T10_6779 [Trichinella papuae]
MLKIAINQQRLVVVMTKLVSCRNKSMNKMFFRNGKKNFIEKSSTLSSLTFNEYQFADDELSKKNEQQQATIRAIDFHAERQRLGAKQFRFS